MNCCDNNKQNGENPGQNPSHNHKGHMSHMLMMALCCGAPVILLLIIPLLGTRFSALRGLLTAITPFLCPLMMIFMIPMMFRGHKKDEACSSHSETAKITENKRLE